MPRWFSRLARNGKLLKRVGGYLFPRTEEAPAASAQIEREGYAVLRGAFSARQIAPIRNEIAAVYAEGDGDDRARVQDSDFRYEMFNRSPRAQKLVGRREILDVIEPLIGEDCHIIANTCWRNPANTEHRHGGGGWHIDAGPHIPRPEGVEWPDEVPYPVFAIGVHIFLEDCPIECGPTGVIPGSHKSGRPPPPDRRMDETLICNGVSVLPLEAKAGDVALFASDVWHRRLPTGDGDTGRFFLQVHYARRDIAQRIKTTATINHVDDAARTRIRSRRERRLLGLHPPGFYDG
ncbi:MAG: phytanoyl-CoA dioxygenase family protein [Gammaproteobacteria bacterium]|nr:phytanoyl-CoA dioxygenase family protein [Gammaproteobacteria bacterium]